MNKLVSAATATAFAGTALVAILNGAPDQALAQRTKKAEASKTENGNAVSADQELGKRFRISPDELPPPKATTSVTNGHGNLGIRHMTSQCRRCHRQALTG